MRKIAVGQAGGPTAVLNASLVGFIDGMFNSASIYAVMNGYQGLVENDFEHLEGPLYDWVQKHKYIPGACLGSGRYDFTPELMVKAVLNLKNNDIHTLVFIGGNGTMAALQKMGEIAKSMNYELQTVGIPKTVDNDLAETDHSPGFASAAKYVAMSVRDSSKDLEAMRNFEQVRIIETMGRNAGWLALGSGLLKKSELDGPHFIYLPEVPIKIDQFLDDVRNSVKSIGMATIIVSEGFTFEGTSKIEREVVKGRSVLGGISNQMEQLIREHVGLTVRSENMGMNQRSSYAISKQDQKEAYEVGKQAAVYVKKGISNIMVSIQKLNTMGYNYILRDVALNQVTDNGERLLPTEFISDRARFYLWLEQIIGEPITSYPPMWRRRVIHEYKNV